MNTKITFIKVYFLPFNIIFLLNISQIISYLSFTYPNAITLKNGNIFVIHKTGITICDSSFSTIINNVTYFSTNEIISNSDTLSKITISQFDDGYIIAAIIDKIYIFNSEGELKKKEIIYNNLPDDIYYTLAPHKIEDGYYYYLVGFVLNNCLCFQYYRYDSKNNYNLLKLSKYDYKDRYLIDNIIYEYTVSNKGLSCLFMTYKDYDIITCLYYCEKSSYSKYLSLAFLIINGDSFTNRYVNEHYEWDNIKCIKSALGDESSIALYCLYKNNGDTQCLFFDYDVKKAINNCTIPKNCIENYYALQVNYFPETEEFVFSCLLKDGGIQFNFYDKTLNNSYNRIYKLTDCEQIFGYSLLYSTTKKKYYILSDAICNGIKYPYEILIEDIVEHEEVKEEEKKEEKEEEKEEKHEQEEKEKEKENEEEQQPQEKEKEEEKKEEKYEEEEEETEEKKDETKKEKEKEVEKIEKDIKNEEEENENQKYILEKCKLFNEDSVSKNLCITCNNEKGYYFLNKYSILFQPANNSFIECIKEELKPSNFYFNNENKDFRPCYERCQTCNYGGDGNENNCTSCDINYILKPDILNSSNCVLKCQYFYYYSSLGYYKRTNYPHCPYDYSLIISEKEKCIDSCENDNVYKFQYNGKCFKECPNNTYHDDNEYLCKDINIRKCLLSENKINYLSENILDNEIEKKAKDFANEFQYTDNHVSIFKNDIYTITLYKNRECISDLSLTIPDINFGECLTKVKKYYEIEENLVIIIVTKKLDGLNYQKMISYSMCNPEHGEKLLYNDICKDNKISVEENLIIKLNNSTDIDSLYHLTNQNVNIFNLSSEFYTDICYHFISPIEGKDIALKDRILLYYPNITLCEDGCQIKGVNLTSFKALCECTLNNIMDNNFLGNNILIQSSLGEIKDMISKTNIEVIKCYKDIFIFKYFINNIGGFIIISLIIGQIISAIIYCSGSLFSIRKYILNITNSFLSYLMLQKNNIMISNYNNSLSSFQNNKITKNKEPPKKIVKIDNNLDEENNYERNNIKGKTSFPKKKSHPNIKRNSLQFRKSIFKKTILEKQLDNNNNLNTGNIINMTKSRNKSKKKFTHFHFKKSQLNEIFSSNNEALISHKYSNPTTIQDIIKNRLMTNKKEENKIEIEEYLRTEVDDMDYDDAIKKDKRRFCQYFYDQLKVNQMILNTFFTKDPLKPRPLKILLFILNICLYLFINGLFFTEDYISQMFTVSNDEGIIPFIKRFLDRFVYITLAGVIISYIIECFFVNEKKIKKILKREKENILI